MDGVELRKVQISGGSTYTLSLPKRWAKAQGVRNGDQLALQERPDGSLTVLPGPGKRRETPTLVVDATKMEGALLLRTLIGTYLSGGDAILVRATPRLSAAQRETVRRFTRICIGPEIVEETGDSVLVRDLVNPAEFTLTTALSRIHVMVHSMIQDALAAARVHDLETARDVQTRDDEVDRLYRLIAKRFFRMLSGEAAHRDPQLTLAEAQRIHQVSRLLERCGDHAVNVAAQTVHLGSRALKPEDLHRILRLGDRAVDLLSRAYQAFRKGDAREANRVVDESKQLLAEKERLLEVVLRYGPQSAPPLSLFVESLERIHQYASDVAEVALNATPADRTGPRAST